MVSHLFVGSWARCLLVVGRGRWVRLVRFALLGSNQGHRLFLLFSHLISVPIRNEVGRIVTVGLGVTPCSQKVSVASAPVAATSVTGNGVSSTLSMQRGVNCNLNSTNNAMVAYLVVGFLAFFCASIFNLAPTLINALFVTLHIFSTVSSPIVNIVTSQARDH